MSFGLKNANLTYKMLATDIVQGVHWGIVEVNIDDMLRVWRRKAILVTKRNPSPDYNMKLNSAKCIYGIQAKKFTGFIITRRGVVHTNMLAICGQLLSISRLYVYILHALSMHREGPYWSLRESLCRPLSLYHEAQSGKVHIWDPSWKVSWVHYNPVRSYICTYVSYTWIIVVCAVAIYTYITCIINACFNICIYEQINWIAT